MKKKTIIIIIIVLVLVILFFPKSCGGVGGIGGPVLKIDCPCVGIKANSLLNVFIMDASKKVCYGICLNNKCEREIINP